MMTVPSGEIDDLSGEECFQTGDGGAGGFFIFDPICLRFIFGEAGNCVGGDENSDENADCQDN